MPNGNYNNAQLNNIGLPLKFYKKKEWPICGFETIKNKSVTSQFNHHNLDLIPATPPKQINLDPKNIVIAPKENRN